MSERKHIFFLSGKTQAKLNSKKGMTQEEWDLENVNPYDLLQVHFLINRPKSSVPSSRLRFPNHTI
jgi:hypothetical protein